MLEPTRLAELLAAVTSAPEGTPARLQARDRLLADVRRLLVHAIQAHRVSCEEADDRAQDKVLNVVAHLERGDAPPGRELSYVWRTGRNAAIDIMRAKKRRAEVPLPEEQGEGRPSRIDEPRVEEELQRKGYRERIRELLEEPGPPEQYKEILRRVYLEAVDIAVLADEERARPGRGGPEAVRTPEKARNAVDVRLSRARHWLKGKLLGGAASGDGEGTP